MIRQLKKQLRKHYKQVLKNIPNSRRDHAAQQAISSLINKHLPPNNSLVLSFYSMSDRHEIDLYQLNLDLADRNRLVLPRVNPTSPIMDCYQVPELTDRYLTKSKYGIYEPDPDRCRSIDPDEISTVLVPGLAFEEQPHFLIKAHLPLDLSPSLDDEVMKYYRLGRGGGYYDRYLTLLNPNTLKLGIAYREQAHSEELPIDQYDQPVDRVIFY